MLTNSFLAELKKNYLDAFAPLIVAAPFEKKEWDFLSKAGRVEVNVSRGPVFEKVCISTIFATVTIPDRDYASTIQWLGIQTFPANPLMPMFMGVFEHVAEQGVEHCPNFFDVFPVVPIEEDRQYLQAELGAIFKKYQRPYPDLPKSYLDMFRLKEAGAGVGYCAGMALPPSEDNFEFFRETATAIQRLYIGIVQKRRSMPYTQEHVAAMQRLRTEWARYTFMDNRFFKGGISLGVPPESFMIHMLPPSVRF
jgi:coproporphyrinogen III oxidase